MNWQFTKGLHNIGAGAYAYLQPNGSWGWSNAGLIVDGDQSLLVDTLSDIPLTAEMLQQMKDATGIGGAEITTLVNTHANGDHTWGNSLVKQAEIIASEATSDQFFETDPAAMATILEEASKLGAAGEFLKRISEPFQHSGITLVPPTRTFSGQLDIKVGDKDVQLIEVGPAHTDGDTLIYVPHDRVIFTGDILFIDTTPIIWAGPVRNWIKACDFIEALDVDVIVPGHGPITDKKGVRQVRDYLEFIDREAKTRFDAGMSYYEAAVDIALGEYRNWLDPERIVVNVYSLYREYSGGDIEGDPTNSQSMLKFFAEMANYLESTTGDDQHCNHD